MRLLLRFAAGFRLWLRLGPVEGTRAALRTMRAIVAPPVRRWVVRLRPPQVSSRALVRALGGRDAAAAVIAARPAIPTAGRWLATLAELGPSARDDLLRRAQDVLEHRFDLLGSGPMELGHQIDWQQDFKSGRSWPLRHISETVISYPDGSDIKVPWELTRFQHLPLLAAAHRLTGEDRWRAEIEAQLTDWMARNPVEHGATWACTMDVAIRAANWTATLVLLDDATLQQPWVRQVVASLLLQARFIRGHLEYSELRGNHYLADIAGLLVVAAVFRTSRLGRRWATWSTKALRAEMDHQVRPDGTDHEASVPYHRLVTELFVCATQAADDLLPGQLDAAYRDRLRRMLTFAADVARPDGMAPSVGDDDSGRFLPLGDYASLDLRDHRHLPVQADVAPHRPATHAAYPDSGYWIMRGGDLWTLVRCGDVGIYGRGCHGHNDALSIELAAGGQPLVVDPGSYLYTADPAARNAFRSVRSHATLQLDEREPNPVTDLLFVLEETAHARCVGWEPETGGRARFTGEHVGFDPARVRREVRFDGPASTVALTDTVTSPSPHAATWRFPLAQPTAVSCHATGAVASFGPIELALEADRPLDVRTEAGWLSPAYGVRVPTTVLVLEGRTAAGQDAVVITLRVTRS